MLAIKAEKFNPTSFVKGYRPKYLDIEQHTGSVSFKCSDDSNDPNKLRKAKKADETDEYFSISLESQCSSSDDDFSPIPVQILNTRNPKFK